MHKLLGGSAVGALELIKAARRGRIKPSEAQPTTRCTMHVCGVCVDMGMCMTANSMHGARCVDFGSFIRTVQTRSSVRLQVSDEELEALFARADPVVPASCASSCVHSSCVTHTAET